MASFQLVDSGECVSCHSRLCADGFVTFPLGGRSGATLCARCVLHAAVLVRDGRVIVNRDPGDETTDRSPLAEALLLHERAAAAQEAECSDV